MRASLYFMRCVCCLVVLIYAEAALAETVVTTYVTTVQEERRSTRWTLTEWLRIKERMKMMDVWLAMFSDPKKDQFRPELNLVFGKRRGAMQYTAVDEAENDDEKTAGSYGRAQLWLTNIFTGSTGVRLLNIDFGAEAGFNHTDDYAPESDITYKNTREIMNTYYTANFRVFGKNIQDSSMVVKWGQYRLRNTIPNLGGENDREIRNGFVTAGELQLYLFRWLGFEGNYFHFDKTSGDKADWRAQGAAYDYGAYVEVSLFRLMVGKYHEEWLLRKASQKTETVEDGLFAGIKIQL